MTLVHTDSRRRVSLGKILEADRDYRVTVSQHGTVTLEPVTAISDYERTLLSNPETVAQFQAAVASREADRRVPRQREPRIGELATD